MIAASTIKEAIRRHRLGHFGAATLARMAQTYGEVYELVSHGIVDFEDLTPSQKTGVETLRYYLSD